VGRGDYQIRTRPFTSEYLHFSLKDLRLAKCLQHGGKALISNSKFIEKLMVSYSENFLDFKILGQDSDDSLGCLRVNFTRLKVGYGQRRYFECPWCREKCSVLYLKQRSLRCRKCCNAKYAIQNTTKLDRHVRNLDTALKGLQKAGGSDCFKPKNITNERYQKILRKLDLLRSKIYSSFKSLPNY